MLKNSYILNMTVLLLGLGLATLFWPNRRGALVSSIILWAAVITGCFYIGWRYYGAWPMTPMYLGTAALPPILAFLGLMTTRPNPWADPQNLLVLRGAIFLALGVGVASSLCPKDFYLPFLKTTSFFSHLHLLFTVLGKAALILAGLWALAGLRHPVASPTNGPSKSQTWLTVGFALWTMSMFAGEIWAYRGWGIPVVWDDAVIITFMATWFYYIAILHLHLTQSWNFKSRSWAASFGIMLILILNCLPDLGPYRPWIK